MADMVCYHATDREAEERIKAQRQFRCGTHGFAGGPIYFSKKEEAACRKYRNGRGDPHVVFKCRVQMGSMYEADQHEVNKDICDSWGTDSVKIRGLDVYAVYDPSRITIMSFKDVRTGVETPFPPSPEVSGELARRRERERREERARQEEVQRRRERERQEEGMRRHQERKRQEEARLFWERKRQEEVGPWQLTTIIVIGGITLALLAWLR